MPEDGPKLCDSCGDRIKEGHIHVLLRRNDILYGVGVPHRNAWDHLKRWIDNLLLKLEREEKL